MVENKFNMAIISPGSVLGQGAIINPDDEVIWQDKATGPFQRVVNGGSFTCSGILCSGNYMSGYYLPENVLVKKYTQKDDNYYVRQTIVGTYLILL